MSKSSRSDLRLYVRALQQGWNIPQGVRTEIVQKLHGIVTAEKSTARERTSAARAIMQASRVELDAIRLAYGAQYENLIKRMETLEEKTDGGLAEAAGGN
jgi:hypothetical protein